ncbi:hypothetical protein Acr_08g0001540 [Actinidia rufa]|uniref:F-box domain-containing protein n=1 Tax=Actinidia rufa TaxID=165716 RepID=A0A7J0EZ96_9ERIC|nr:hypothetical protein Acr_08g0001540 [Actinidia rufa]
MDLSMKKKQLKENPLSKQCVTLESEDRLSTLPEELRRHIISFLPMKDAVRSSILSRKWSRICYSLPNLIFEFHRFPNVESKLDRFVEFIDQMISRQDDSRIKTFKLAFWVENETFTRIKNAWITFAVQRNVENLILTTQMGKTQSLPSCIFTSKSLKGLHLGIHDLKLPTSIDLPNLKELVLMSVILADHNSTRKLFSSCPALETLVMKTCDLYHLGILAISAPNLKHFVIQNCSGFYKCEINLLTPRLKTFFYHADVPRDINTGNIPFVNTVFLFFENTHPWSTNHSFSAAKELEQPPYMLFYLEMNSQDFSHIKLLNHLEYVEIRNFEGCDIELEIVEFLLNNAKVLVEMKLIARESRDHTGLTVGINCVKIRSINKKLLAMRRASSRAKILFSYIM